MKLHHIALHSQIKKIFNIQTMVSAAIWPSSQALTKIASPPPYAFDEKNSLEAVLLFFHMQLQASYKTD